MARFYTNENIPLPVVIELRRLGHDVLTVVESGRAGIAMPDKDVLAFAASDRRILVTLNRRHFIRLHLDGSVHEGIVVCTFDPDFKRQAAALDRLVGGRTDMRGCLERVNRPPP